MYIIVATIPIGIVGLALSKVLNACDSPLRTPLLVGAASFVVALIMGLAEWTASHKRKADSLTLWDSIIIGLAQVGALIPGVSRSGATFSGAMFLGFNREDAARVSFLLGIPAIFLAGAKEIWEMHKAGLPDHGWSILARGPCRLVAVGLRGDLGPDAVPAPFDDLAACDLSRGFRRASRLGCNLGLDFLRQVFQASPDETSAKEKPWSRSKRTASASNMTSAGPRTARRSF